jgi:hypothetical protein
MSRDEEEEAIVTILGIGFLTITVICGIWSAVIWLIS